MNQQIIVEKLFDNPRIDIFVINKLKNLTRATAKKMIMDGIILLNNAKVKSNAKVKVGDIITIQNQMLNSFLEGNRKAQIKPFEMFVDILFEDNDILAINKPAGLVSHPVPGHRDNTLLNGLVYYAQKKKVKNLERFRLVHRLDKETSGVIIASKNLASHEKYSKLFQTNDIQKTYYAVVKGDFLKKYDKKDLEINGYIKRSKKDKKVYELSKDMTSNSRYSQTIVNFERYWKGLQGQYSLLKIKPITGRTHQIRVHLQSIGFPIIGDTFYNGYKYERLMLHAQSVYIKKLDLLIESNLPREFRK